MAFLSVVAVPENPRCHLPRIRRGGRDCSLLPRMDDKGLCRAFIGSVAEGTVRHAACPELGVPSIVLRGRPG